MDWNADAVAEPSFASAGAAHSCELCTKDTSTITDILPILVPDVPDAAKEVLVYVAGYLCFKHASSGADHLDSRFEFESHGAYLTSLNRGRLTIPGDGVVTFVYFAYIMFVYSQAETLSPCYKATLSSLHQINAQYELLFDDSQAMAICRTLCNVMHNNFTKTFPKPDSKEPAIKLAKLSCAKS